MIAKIIIDAIRSMVRAIVVLIILLTFSLFVWALSGIRIDAFKFAGLEAQQLYIKLGKKITLRAKHIVLPSSSRHGEFKNPLSFFERFKSISEFFEYIDLDHVVSGDTYFDLFYADGVAHFQTSDFETAVILKRNNDRFVIEVPMLRLKNPSVLLEADATYDPDNNLLKGTAYAVLEKDFRVPVDFLKQGDRLTLRGESVAVTTLKPLADVFGLKGALRRWILDRIRAERYVLERFGLEIYRDDTGWKADRESLRAKLKLIGAKVLYHPKLPCATSDQIEISLQGDRIEFLLKKPRYSGRSLEGSKVYITDLFSTTPRLYLSLRIDSQLDKEVQRILRAYRLDIPVYFKGSNALVSLDMSIGLDRRKKGDLDANVYVATKEGILRYRGLVLPVKKSEFFYDTNVSKKLKGKVILGRGKIGYKKRLSLPVVSGRLDYDDKQVTLSNVRLRGSEYDLFLMGKLDLDKRTLAARTEVKRLKLGSKKGVTVEVVKRRFPLRLTYSSNGFQADIKPVGLSLNRTGETTRILLRDLSLIRPYLQALPIRFDGGEIAIVTDDFKRYRFKGFLKDNRCFFYAKRRCFTRIPFRGKSFSGVTSLSAFGGKLAYRSDRHSLKLKNLHIDLKKLLSLYGSGGFARHSDRPLKLRGQKSYIRYDDYLLVTDYYDASLWPNGDLKAKAEVEKRPIVLTKRKGRFSLQASKVGDKVLKPLLPFLGLSGGRYTVKMSGDPEDKVEGVVIVEGGTFRSEAYRRTAQTVESLPVSKQGGIGLKDFKIDRGRITFIRTPERLILKTIDIKGEQKSFIGKGVINLERKTLRIDLALHIAKDLGKVIGSLPLVGYILMGKDKSIVIGLEVRGSVDNPKVTTTAAKDILLLPFTLIKRTLEAPKTILQRQ